MEALSLNEPSTEIEIFAKRVLDKLIEDSVEPIPYYYSIYFFNMLDEEPEAFQKTVKELIDLESNNELEEDLKFEQKLKESFKYSKELLQDSAMIYKISNTLKEKNQMFLKEAESVSTPQAFKNMLRTFKKNTEMLSKKLDQVIHKMKDVYAKNITTLKEIEKESMFDALYGLYNKNYFLKGVKKEIAQVKKFKHASSLMLLKASKEVMGSLSDKGKIVVNRFVAKILLKTSRRTDIIAHLGDGVFAMLLKHTDKVGAMKTSERLSDMISTSTIFIEGDELEVKIVIGISEITGEKNEVEIVECANNKLIEAEEDGVLYKICEDD
ncbi:MAG: diguanylate cyclase [Epsilonproteobacteria bacterium]|nr:diguanylate cyclase [Campylobacterota bacterium]